MRGIILVGGEGTRLRPLTCELPKPMVPIVNRPFLEHMIAYLAGHGIDDITLSLCYLPDRIREHFGDGSAHGVRLRYVVEPTPMGTAGAIRYVAGEAGFDGTTFVFNGDVFTDLDLTAMLDYHRRAGAKVTISLTPVEDPTSYGVVEQEPDGRVRRFVEKPSRDAVTSNNINAGTYILEPEVLDYIPNGQHYMFENGLFPDLLRRGDAMYGYVSAAYWIDIGTPARYLTVHRDLLSGRCAFQPGGRLTTEQIWLGEGAQIAESAKLTGPIVLGRNVSIGQDCRLTGPVVIGDGVTIGDQAALSNAVIWAGAQVGAGAIIDGSIIGRDARIGSGVSVVDGAIVGDRAVVEASNRLDRGVKIWPGRHIPEQTIQF